MSTNRHFHQRAPRAADDVQRVFAQQATYVVTPRYRPVEDRGGADVMATTDALDTMRQAPCRASRPTARHTSTSQPVFPPREHTTTQPLLPAGAGVRSRHRVLLLALGILLALVLLDLGSMALALTATIGRQGTTGTAASPPHRSWWVTRTRRPIPRSSWP